MSLPEIAINRPVFAWMLMAGLILFGGISFERLGVSQLPDVDFPVISVGLNLPGAAPEVIESQVLDPIEDSVMQIDGIRSVTSSAQQSSGSIAIEFELNRDIDLALQEVKNHIQQVQNLLPTSLFPPTLRKTNPEDQPIMWVTLSSDDPKIKPIDMMMFARNFLQNQLGVVAGVGNVVTGGYVDPALRIWADLDKLDKYELTATDLTTAIKNEHMEIPGGVIANDKHEYNVRVMGEATSPEEFGKITIQSRAYLGANYIPTPINKVATVEEGLADIRRMSRFNGKRAIGLGVIKQHGANAVEVGENVRKKVKELRPLIPPHYHLDIRSDNTRFIKQSVNELIFTLVLSALLTSLVCYAFLGSWTSTVNVLMAIPTSIVGAFTAFYALNYTLNTFTLLGLSLAIGIVVDDAIMMLENIVRHMELGESRRQASIKGSNEITFAALAATIAVVAIFLPVVFMTGIIGKYFVQYGVTVTVAVLLSLLEALTLTPMRCSRMLTINHSTKGFAARVDRFFRNLAEIYERILRRLLNHRGKTIFATLVFFAISLGVKQFLPSEMIPAQDQSMFLLRFKLPVGTSLPVTDAKIKQVEDLLLKVPEVDGIFSAVGGFGGDAVNQGMAFATLVDKDKRKLSQSELVKKLRAELKKAVPGMEIVVQDLSQRGFAATRGFPVEFIIQGPDWDKLRQITTGIMDEMKKSGIVTDVNTDVQSGMPEAQLTPDRAAMAAHGVQVGEVTSVINTLMGGDVMTGTTEYSKAQHRYEIETRLRADQRDKVPDLNRVRVRNNRGQTVRLSQLVKQEVKPSLMLISRLNRARAITVYANPAPGHAQDEALKAVEAMARKSLPAGYRLKMIGSAQSYRESMLSLFMAMILGLVVSYMVLASQFNSFVHPVAVLLALPFSISGAFLGLLLFHQSLNIFSLIGLILLMGIVKKNSILLVDFTNQCRGEGMDVRAALIKACPVRLRPILMTSVATVAGALPEALAIGPGAETTIPMAVAIIGGVIASTVLTLFVVPCAYSLLTNLEKPDVLDEAAFKPVLS